jgi:nucleotide-binding universal stress UspA family protein
MFRRILVPLDGSAQAEEALRVAQALAMRLGAWLVLLHAAPLPGEETGAAQAELDLEAHVERLREQGCDAEAVVRYDRPARSILRSARVEHADLIVLAPQQRAGLERLLHRSVTAGVIPHARVPVLVVPPTASAGGSPTLLTAPEGRILVPLDGSALAEQAVLAAIGLARALGQRLLLVNVVSPLPLAGPIPESMTLAAHAQFDRESEAHTYVAAVRSLITSETPLKVQTSVAVGDPRVELPRIAQSHHVSLIAMTTHGRSGLARFLFGSVAIAVSQRSPVPVLIVPASATLPEQLPVTRALRPEAQL